MQDYSPLQYEMFNQLYQCPKTVLGDIYQCIDKIIEYDELDKYAKILGAKSILTLNKTYRSTYEITMFANKIKGLNNQCVDRHGDEVVVEKFENIEKECEFIENLVKNNKKFDNIAIICKTNEQAQLYYAHLSKLEELMLIDEKSSLSKLMIMSAGVCKGLEFDMVILPNVSSENYNNFMDKNLLYVSSSRALHKLVVTCHSDVSKFI